MSKKILLYVEDDRDARELVTEALALKYPEVVVHTAENGAAGLAAFTEHRPEVVITDIRMPLMDGIEMGAKIKAIDPDAYLIAVTAYSDGQSTASATETGFSDYLHKPIDYKKLFALLDPLLRQERK